MNYYHVDQDGTVEFKLGPLYVSSYSQIEYDEDDGIAYDISAGFTDIYLDLPYLGLYHIGLNSGPVGNRFQFRRLEA